MGAGINDFIYERSRPEGHWGKKRAHDARMNLSTQNGKQRSRESPKSAEGVQLTDKKGTEKDEEGA